MDNTLDKITEIIVDKLGVDSEKITRYMLKEDWIWDRQRSERYVRIIGIAPVIYDVAKQKEPHIPNIVRQTCHSIASSLYSDLSGQIDIVIKNNI